LQEEPAPWLNFPVSAQSRKAIDCAAKLAAESQSTEERLFRLSLGESRQSRRALKVRETPRCANRPAELAEALHGMGE